MNQPIDLPPTLRVDAWPGDAPPPCQELPERTTWGLRPRAFRSAQWLSAPEVDERDWRDPEVGWGLVLPDDDPVGAADKAMGEDAPEPLRRLLAARPGSPVLRYRADLRVGYLRRYDTGGTPHDLSAPNPGTGRGRVPRYRLLYGSPAASPGASSSRSTCPAA